MGRQVRITLEVDSKGAIKAVGATDKELDGLRGSVVKLEKELDTLSASVQAGLITPTESAQKESKLLERHLRDLISKGVDPASAGFQRYKKVLDQMQAEQATAASSTRGVASSTNTANLALMDFTRIAEDSAFGIRGVANNINPAIQSFNRLKVETGSTTGALKGMLSAMTGTGGIMFAIGALSSLAIALGPKLADAFGKGSEAAERLKKASEEAFDAIANFESGFKGVRITPENIEGLIRETEAQIRFLKEFQASGVGGRITDEQISTEEDLLERLQDQKDAFAEQERLTELLVQRGAERVIEEEEVRRSLEGQTRELNRQYAARIAFLNLLASSQGAMEGRGPRRLKVSDAARPSELEQMAERLGLSKDQLREFSEGTEAAMQKVRESLEGGEDAFDAFGHGIQAAAQAVGLLQQAFSNAHQQRMNEINAERRAALSAIDQQLDKENLTTRKRTELLERKNEIQERFREKEREAMREQAKRNKLLALFDIALNTAVAVSKVWGQTGLAGAIFQGTAIAMGAAQMALVAAQPIPEFEKGVTNFEGGLARVHEGELLVNMPRGTDVITREHTERLLERPSIPGGGMSDSGIRQDLQNTNALLGQVASRMDRLEVNFNIAQFGENWARFENEETRAGRR